ncbi:MAG: hypothetical protein RMJ19_02575 [Gemmatales bacterium]|nr:carboxypeptidase-like regulatory domain-containing protein [Gemmatales bacterium]MDW8174533.1 hypothetical protein [Gemmatales bacterium]
MLWLAGLILPGCSGQQARPATNPNLEVQGRVALAQGLNAVVVIQFYGSSGGMEAYTSANPPDGQFHIPGPPRGPGVAPGEYKVVVIDPDRKAGVPDAWQDLARTPLKVTINEQTAQKLVIGE